jgi:hypothetical protein
MIEFVDGNVACCVDAYGVKKDKNFISINSNNLNIKSHLLQIMLLILRVMGQNILLKIN